jgi:hypothetical protein
MLGFRSKSNIEKKRSKRRKVLFLFPILIILILFGFCYYAFASQFHIKDIKITESAFVKTEEVKAIVDGILSQKMWKFIPRKSSLLVRKNIIELALYAAFPPIKEVKVEIHDNVLFVNITERTATSVLCTSATECYFLDDEGFAFVSAPQFEGNSFIKIQAYNSDISSGKLVVSKDELQKIVKEIALFKYHSNLIMK